MKYFNGGIMIGGKPFKFEKSQTIFIVYAGGSRPCIEICSTEAEVDSVASWKSEKDKIFFSNGLLYMTDREGVTERVPMQELVWVDENGNFSEEMPEHPLKGIPDGVYNEEFKRVMTPQDGGQYFLKKNGRISFGKLVISKENTYHDSYDRENKDTYTGVSVKETMTIDGKVLIEKILVTI